MKAQHLIFGSLLATAITIWVLSGKPESPESNSSSPLLLQQNEITPAKNLLAVSEMVPVKMDPVISNKSTTPEKCVFKTAFEGEGLEKGFYYKIPGKVVASIDKGLGWLESAQNRDGGWGAGSHRRQQERDPHAVQSDPATTAMVAMALQRSGTSLQNGPYSKNLRDALEFLLEQVETSPENSSNITSLTYTQPQSKLGQNIDVVLTSQFLTNIISDLDHDPQLKQRVRKSVRKCIAKMKTASNRMEVKKEVAGLVCCNPLLLLLLLNLQKMRDFMLMKK